MIDSSTESERRDGNDRRHGFELNTKFGSIKAFGEGMLLLLVIGMFLTGGSVFYLAQLINNQLIALELSQRMTMCVLAIGDTEERWAQITQPNSACSMLARQAVPGK